MAEIDLIHAGLPWNNPQKITVKADQYISQLVINRGLLNLLSNDYYLDLKTQRINQYIVQLLGPHINDVTIHWTEDGLKDIIQRILNSEFGSSINGIGLTKDTAFIIPVLPSSGDIKEEFPKNVNRIQNIINNCPKNLNGHTAIFALTPVSDGDYNHTIGQYYSKNKDVEVANIGCYNSLTNIQINWKSINLNSFCGGTIILMGNDFFTCEEKYKDKGKILNTRQTRILLQQIQKNIDKDTSKLISIVGNGNNNNCSVISFNNCNCDSYIWNIEVVLDNNIQSDEQTNTDTPKKKDLSLYFPCNLVDDIITGNIRYVIADTINDENFNQSYITLRSKDQIISGGETEGIEGTISAINLSGDYLLLSSFQNQFIQTFFGKYIDDQGIQIDSLYEGATLCFWMKDDFYDKNINEVPILYSVDSNGNGYYIGLDKVANIQYNDIDIGQYIDTTFVSKKRTDFNNIWNFWAIQIEPIDMTTNLYGINISYYNSNAKKLLTILPNATTNNDITRNQLVLKNLNFGSSINLFGTQDIRSEAYIRNILLFNQPLETKNIEALAQQGISNSINLSEIDQSKTFVNDMKGALYVYNTTSMNVIGCKLTKRLNNA